MFVLDNGLVREDWSKAKGVVTAALEKHGGKVHTARRWDERRLAYPIAKRQRGTYLLTYFDMEQGGLPPLARDLELSEPVLRHLILQAEVVPETEVELTQAEAADDFVVPAPPADDAVDEEETSFDERDDRRDRRDRRDGRDGGPRGDAASAAPKAEEAATEKAPESADKPAAETSEPAAEAAKTPETAEAPSPTKEG